MFDPSAFTISVQAAGGSGDWRIWHYVVVDDTSLADVTAKGFFSSMAAQITSGSLVHVIAPTYVAQLALVKVSEVVSGVLMCKADVPEDADAPHIQFVPGQMGGNTPAANHPSAKA